jgi:hypothetical protein
MSLNAFKRTLFISLEESLMSSATLVKEELKSVRLVYYFILNEKVRTTLKMVTIPTKELTKII